MSRNSLRTPLQSFSPPLNIHPDTKASTKARLEGVRKRNDAERRTRIGDRITEHPGQGILYTEDTSETATDGLKRRLRDRDTLWDLDRDWMPLHLPAEALTFNIRGSEEENGSG